MPETVLLPEYPIEGEFPDSWVFADQYGMYIGDDLGEIVSWVDTEFDEDPHLYRTAFTALSILSEHGSDFLRKVVDHPVRRHEGDS